jgi:DNA-binding CsgD family transcriptional regulator
VTRVTLHASPVLVTVVVTALSARDVARLTLALGALLGPVAGVDGGDAALVAEVLTALLGGAFGLLSVARDGAVQWLGEGAADAESRALVDPWRAPPGRTLRATAQGGAWLLAPGAPGEPAPHDGSSTVAVGLWALCEPDAVARFACRLPLLHLDNHAALARVETLLGLMEPVFAAAMQRRLALQPQQLARRSATATATPATPAAPAGRLPQAMPHAVSAIATEETSVLLAVVLADRYALTARETDVAKLLLLGWSNSAVASALGISESTARHHTERVLGKLGISSRAEVAWRALHPEEPGRGGAGTAAPGRRPARA